MVYLLKVRTRAYGSLCTLCRSPSMLPLVVVS